MHCRNPIKIMCTTRLNNGIFTVHRVTVATSTRLRKPEYDFRFYVYGKIFDNQPGFLSARGTVWFYFCFFVFLWPRASEEVLIIINATI
jgi:hypothetical protein